MDFLEQLSECLETKKTFHEEKTYTDLIVALRNFGSSFNSIYNYMVQKGLIKEDLYNYEQKSRMEPPSSEPIPDGELISELSFRLSSYNNVLDYVNNLYQLDNDKLNLPGIKQILAIVNYIKWGSLGVTTNSPVTRGFSLILEKIVPDSDDPMSSEVRFNLVKQMDELQNKIKTLLKDISIFQREWYKLQVRKSVIPLTNLDEDAIKRDSRKALLIIKKKMYEVNPEESFFRELIEEIFAEDNSEESENLRAKLLKSMEMEEAKKIVKKEKKQELPHVDKTTLLRILPELGKMSNQLSGAISKLEQNNQVVNSQKRSFMDFIRKFFSSKEKEVFYEVKTVDPHSGQTRRETINFNKFVEKVRLKSHLLKSVTSQTTPLFSKLSNTSEEAVFEFIENNIIDIRAIHKKLDGLDNMFKKETEQALRSSIRGIKVEVDTLRRNYSECFKKLKEYSAIKEEMDQLEALGIKNT